MSTKSHVSMEQHVCVACGNAYDTGAILLAKRYHENPRTRQMEALHPMDRTTITGWGMCPEHQQVLDDGYVILIGADNPEVGERISPENANRTGDLLYVRREVAGRMFNVEIRDIAFIDPEAVATLKGFASQAPGQEEDEQYDKNHTH